MAESPLHPEVLKRAADEYARLAEAGGSTRTQELDRAAQVVAEVLLDLAEHRSATAATHVVDARMLAAGVETKTVTVPSGRPLEVLRSGARNEVERALVATLLARHLETVLARRDGIHTLRAMLPSLDWLEFVGLYPPYTAARHALDGETLARVDEVLAAAPVEAPTEAVALAIRALRGAPVLSESPSATPSLRPTPSEAQEAERAPLSVAGELEGAQRSRVLRVLLTLTPVAAVMGAARAVLRVAFVMRSPATVTLDGDVLRVKGHTEVLGRVLREYEHHFPVDGLAEVDREARYAWLPVAASVFALSLGSIYGAQRAIEGVHGQYFGLVALGLGCIAGGLFFDWLMRALFPGVKGRTRLGLRAVDARGVVLTELPISELDRLVDALEVRLKERTIRVPRSSYTLPRREPAVAPDLAMSAATERDPAPPGSA